MTTVYQYSSTATSNVIKNNPTEAIINDAFQVRFAIGSGAPGFGFTLSKCITSTDHDDEYLGSLTKWGQKVCVLEYMKRGEPLMESQTAIPLEKAKEYFLRFLKDDVSWRSELEWKEWKKEGCFIATACFGCDDGRTEVLRRFRDRYLRRLPGGENLIDLYYRRSPRMADELRSRPRLRKAVGCALSWMTGALEHLPGLQRTSDPTRPLRKEARP